MANNKSIQILRAGFSKYFDIGSSDEVLAQGQPFYNNVDKKLYIGLGNNVVDGEETNQLKNLKGTEIGLPISYLSSPISNHLILNPTESTIINCEGGLNIAGGTSLKFIDNDNYSQNDVSSPNAKIEYYPSLGINKEKLAIELALVIEFNANSHQFKFTPDADDDNNGLSLIANSGNIGVTVLKANNKTFEIHEANLSETTTTINSENLNFKSANINLIPLSNENNVPYLIDASKNNGLNINLKTTISNLLIVDGGGSSAFTVDGSGAITGASLDVSGSSDSETTGLIKGKSLKINDIFRVDNSGAIEGASLDVNGGTIKGGDIIGTNLSINSSFGINNSGNITGTSLKIGNYSISSDGVFNGTSTNANNANNIKIDEIYYKISVEDDGDYTYVTFIQNSK